jgi:hypothetical protein
VERLVAQFKFDRQFQTQILALMVQDLEFLIFASENIDPDYFSDAVLAWYFKQLRDHFLDYQILMQPTSLRNELIQAAAQKKIKEKDVPRFKEIYAVLIRPVLDADYIKDQVITFCRHQAPDGQPVGRDRICHEHCLASGYEHRQRGHSVLPQLRGQDQRA